MGPIGGEIDLAVKDAFRGFAHLGPEDVQVIAADAHGDHHDVPYLHDGKGLKSWLFTLDHKRIGVMYLFGVLIAFALAMLNLPYLKLVGALLLLWIGVKLLQPEEEGGHEVAASDKLWSAVKTVIVADLVMSIDNVMAIAGAAENAAKGHQLPLVIFGLLFSIPIIVWGSQFILKLMERFPVIITLGGMLLGWIAGSMLITDPATATWWPAGWLGEKGDPVTFFKYCSQVLGALLVLALGKGLASRQPGDQAG